MAARIGPSSLWLASHLRATQGPVSSLLLPRSTLQLKPTYIYRISHGPFRTFSLSSPLHAKPKPKARKAASQPPKPPHPPSPGSTPPPTDPPPKASQPYRPVPPPRPATSVTTAAAKAEARKALFYRIFQGPFKYSGYFFFAYLGLSTGLFAYHLSSAAPFHSESQTPHGSHPTGQPSDLRQPSSTDPSDLCRKADLFNTELTADERVSGISGLRARLAARARGDVLEVASGTGRNFGYYDWSGVVTTTPSPSEDNKMRSFTAVDISDGMLLFSRNELRALVPGLKALLHARRAEPLPVVGGPVLDVLDGRVRLFKGDAQDAALPPPASGGRYYDTVVQTFGLCSVSDPVKLLANVAGVVRPGTGRILLMDHGRGWWERFNRAYLDRLAVEHFGKYGCWWNRDIEGLVREAARTVPGLEIVKVERPWWPMHLGTTCITELRVRADGEDGGGGQEVKL
ncbi:S-adenosyl-L-methionine-dependent methyltransferase [Schizothecium vesticola]|uniref:S-adenosyl-L-methionine-dependent methyltransferase n=1 Tax=Schizothecium vesticola TaxID=314040 RepID=A0AA40EPP5_9PEZI|nr:S-adenosyl-L-methionine-dependent methyltransferase [Schizothecium vesticola]